MHDITLPLSCEIRILVPLIGLIALVFPFGPATISEESLSICGKWRHVLRCCSVQGVGAKPDFPCGKCLVGRVEVAHGFMTGGVMQFLFPVSILISDSVFVIH